MTEHSDEGPGTSSISRALYLLAHLADAPGPVTVKQVSADLKVPPSTAHRLLNALAAEGVVVASGSGIYRIGPRFYRISARVVQGMSQVTIAQPIVDALAAKYNETVLLGRYVAADRAMDFVYRANGSQMLTYQIDLHRPMSLYWGASGKAILAFLPDDEIKQTLLRDSASSVSGEKPPSLRARMAELREVRERGYAISEGEKLPGARGVAAPIFDAKGVFGCLCMTSPQERMPNASIGAIVKDIMEKSDEISRFLGAAR